MTEEELITLALNNNKEAKNTLYNNYKYIIDILMHKYYNLALKYNIDLKELESEASYALSEALNSYNQALNTKLSTFISLCIDRRLKKIIKRYRGKKSQIINNTYSLDYDYEEGLSLKDTIVDPSSDPLYSLTNKEDYQELLAKIKKVLSLI